MINRHNFAFSNMLVERTPALFCKPSSFRAHIMYIELSIMDILKKSIHNFALRAQSGRGERNCAFEDAPNNFQSS
jgi:hypothetical protein